MSIKTRRILYIVFILAFLIITPLLILYSMGYTFNSGFKLEKSGILVVETEPSGAKIFINNEAVQEFWNKIIKSDDKYIYTPAKIKNLKPGEYEVRIELAGYWPWTKKLTINSGQTTFAEDIFLFRNNNATLIHEFSQGQNSFSPEKNYFVNIGQTEANLVDLEKAQNEKYIIDTQKSSSSIISKNLLWSIKNNHLLNSQNIYYIDKWTDPIYLSDSLGSNLTKYNWANDSEDTILYTTNNKLFSFNIKNNNNKEIYSAEHIEAFTKKGNDMLLLIQSDNKSSLEVLQDGQSKTQVLLDLPFSEYDFLNPAHPFINLLDKNNKILYIVDQNSILKPLKDKINDCETMRWVSDSQLLYTNGFEIWLYNLDTKEKILLTRLSERILGIEWHPSNNYILFATEKNINILELDNREKHNITKIIDAVSIKEMILDKNGENIFFTSSEDGKTKLYKIIIQ